MTTYLSPAALDAALDKIYGLACEMDEGAADPEMPHDGQVAMKASAAALRTAMHMIVPNSALLREGA